MKSLRLCLISLLVFALQIPHATGITLSQSHHATKTYAKPNSVSPSPASGKKQKAKAALIHTNPSELSPAVVKKLDAIPVRGHWRHIVIHHSGTASGKPKALDRYHRQRGMENGLAYHFIIGNGHGMKDGEIFIGDRWKRQIKGGHLASDELNEVSIGICLIGNFDIDKPTKAQMASLQALSQRLLHSAHLTSSAITTHCLIHPKHTDCPGRHFPLIGLRTELAKK